MNRTLSRFAGGVAAGIASATAVAGGALWLMAPRYDETVSERWKTMAGFRYAHRGLHDISVGIPENSLAAFREARQLGFGCELDVHLSADGKLVVIHDSHLGRLCGLDAKVEDLTLSELADLHLQDTGHTIPTLEAVLSLYEWNRAASKEPPAPLIIELKSAGGNHNELARRTAQVLDNFNVRYAIESFDPKVLAWFKQYRPEVIRGILAEDSFKQKKLSLKRWQRVAQSALLANVLARPDFIAYRFEDRDNPFAQLSDKFFHAHQVSWTIRNQADMLIAEAEGATVIFEGFTPGDHSTIRSL